MSDRVSTRKNLPISLPPEMARLVDRAAKLEHRTRSELVREALRHYLAGKRIPVATVSAEEAKEIDLGRREIARGEYVTLEQLLHDLEDPPRAAP